MKKIVKKKRKLDLDFTQNCKGTVSLTEIAGMIPNGQYSLKSLSKFLRECEFFHKRTIPYKKYEKQGLVILKIKSVADGKKLVTVPRFTLKGVEHVLNLVNKGGEHA